MTEEEKKRKLSWDNALRGEPTSFGRPVENKPYDAHLTGAERIEGNYGLDRFGKPVENGANGQDGVNGSDGQQGMRNYDDIYNYLDEQIKATAPETEEQRKRRVRTERTQALVNGIADVGRAFANLMATNNYAPNGYEQSQSLSDKARERWDKASAERAKRRAENWNYHLQKAKLQGDERDYEFKVSEAKRKAEREQQKIDNQNALVQAKKDRYDALTKLSKAQTSKNEAQIAYYQKLVEEKDAKIHYLELGADDKHAETLARMDAQNALAEKRRSETGGTTTTTTINRDSLGRETGRTVEKRPNAAPKSNNNATPQGGAKQKTKTKTQI